jgi:hypothetical protein
MVRDAMEQSAHCRIFTATTGGRHERGNFPGVAYGKEEIICAEIQIVDCGSGQIKRRAHTTNSSQGSNRSSNCRS